MIANMRKVVSIPLTLFVFTASFFIYAPAYASTTTGPNNPGTSAGTAGANSCTNSVNWGNTGTPGNASANDSNFITITGTQWDAAEKSDELRLSNFSFSIPTGSTILGIKAETLLWANAGTAAYTTVQLFSAPGTNVGTNKATGNVPTSDPGSTYATWGGTADTWSSGLTAAQISDSNFGIALCFTAGSANSNMDVDHVRVSVTYDSIPILSIAQPDGTNDTVTVGDTYDITYSLDDPDNVVTAAFYYDTDNTGLNGTAITGACATAAEGSGATCSWNTTGIAPGSYYIYGITNDGVNSQVSAYSSGQITINALSAPTVTTQTPSPFSDTSAILNGNIIATGGATPTVRGFAYGTSPTLATVIATTTETGSWGTGAFTFDAKGLSCGTTYYARAYARNSVGTGIGTSIESVNTSTCSLSPPSIDFLSGLIRFLSGRILIFN